MATVAGNDVLDVAVVGCGRISDTYMQALALLSCCRLRAVADLNEGAARRAAARYGCAAYRDYRDLPSGTAVDAIVIATPPNTHAEIAGFFLGGGVHVLCEKPFALSVTEAALMLGQARQTGCALMMASKFRYVDAVVEARKLVESGALGEVFLFKNAFCDEVDMRGRWNSDKTVAGGGVLIDNGCHSVDIARFLLGPITTVFAEAGENVQPLSVEDTVRLYLRTAAGAEGVATLSWSMRNDREDYISLLGTEGTASIGWTRSRYKRNEEREWTDFGAEYNKLDAVKLQIGAFVNSIAAPDALRDAMSYAYASVEVIEAAYRSMRLKTWVEVGPNGPSAEHRP